MDVMDAGKDWAIIAVGGGMVWKAVAAAIEKIRSGNKSTQTVTVNATPGSNGRSYATSDQLSQHALKCAGALHEKVNDNYNKLSAQIHKNHTEVIKGFADLRVSITRLETNG